MVWDIFNLLAVSESLLLSSPIQEYLWIVSLCCFPPHWLALDVWTCPLPEGWGGVLGGNLLIAGLFTLSSLRPLGGRRKRHGLF